MPGRPRRVKLRGLISAKRAKTILGFTPEPYDKADLAARFFADYYGVPEDPATGSANGCLVGYLVETAILTPIT